MQQAFDRSPTAAIKLNLANRHGWMADAIKLTGRYEEALEHRMRQDALLNEILQASPDDLRAREQWVGGQRAIAGYLYRRNDIAGAKTRLVSVRRYLADMVRHDPKNADWKQQLSEAQAAIAVVEN